MVLIWMPVYNEARFLKQTIDSVLGQTHEDFKLVISDNHSTDGSSEIISNVAEIDNRVIVVRPPTHLISMDHFFHIWNNVLPSFTGAKYSIFIGGHDIWSPNLLESLLERAMRETTASIVFPDTYELDLFGNVTRKYISQVQVCSQDKAYIPHSVLFGLTVNDIWGGLWEETRRKRVSPRYRCCGVDMLMIAEIGIYGHLLHEPSASLYLRQAPNHLDGWTGYLDKHIPPDVRKLGYRDFLNQLDWVCSIADIASEGHHFCGQELVRPMYKTSLLSAYICRYVHHLFTENGMDQYFSFFDSPEVREYLQLQGVSSKIIYDMISK